MNRNEFLKGLLASAAGLAAGGLSIGAGERAGAIPSRRLGGTGKAVPILGLGGYHIGVPGSEKAAREIVETALDEGIRFFDNAESYHAGRSERFMGKALRGVREQVFLMTKTHAPETRSAESAKRHLGESLDRLGTDYLDLWQLHSIKSVDDVDRSFRTGGAMEYILRMKQEGVVRYVGVTGHVDPAAHVRALELHDEGLAFDTVQLPVNPIDYHQKSFQRRVLPGLTERGLGVIAMKTSAQGALVREGVCSFEECLRYVWTLPIGVAVVGMESPAEVKKNAHLARRFRPMERASVDAFLDRIAPGASLDLEWYKRG